MDRIAIVGSIVVALCATSCATTRQLREEPEKSGFLGDYSQLEPGGDDRARLVYISPDASWVQYNQILIDSVTIWKDSETSELADEDAQHLTDHFFQQLHEQLQQDYVMAESAGPGVMRLRVAITEARGAKVAANAVTTILPQFRLLASLGGLATDTATFVGRATIEAEITDSLTDVRLAAAVDERVGGKTIRGGLKEWSHVDRAFEFWAKRLRERLLELRTTG